MVRVASCVTGPAVDIDSRHRHVRAGAVRVAAFGTNSTVVPIVNGELRQPVLS
jgi:hypothetical protein